MDSVRKARLEKFKRKDQSGMKSEQVCAGGSVGDGAFDCTQSDPGGWQTSAARHRCSCFCSCCCGCSQGDSNVSTAALFTPEVQAPLLPCFVLCFSLGYVFFFFPPSRAHLHTPQWFLNSLCVRVIFMKILPSTLNSKCSGSSGGRTRGFGVLSAFTPGVEAPG